MARRMWIWILLPSISTQALEKGQQQGRDSETLTSHPGETSMSPFVLGEAIGRWSACPALFTGNQPSFTEMCAPCTPGKS